MKVRIGPQSDPVVMSHEEALRLTEQYMRQGYVVLVEMPDPADARLLYSAEELPPDAIEVQILPTAGFPGQEPPVEG